MQPINHNNHAMCILCYLSHSIPGIRVQMFGGGMEAGEDPNVHFRRRSSKTVLRNNKRTFPSPTVWVVL